MPYSASTGIYSASAGSETATAGQTIASATWDLINSDYRTALTTLGQAQIPVLTAGIKNCYFQIGPQVVNFGASASDVATFTIVLPSTVSIYRVESLRIAGAAGNLNGTTVTLYTGANATGTTVIGSTATTITSPGVNTANSAQVIVGSAQSTIMYQAAQLFLHISTSVATSTTAMVALRYEPMF